MPEIVYYVAASIDGFIATPDGGVAWLDEFPSPEDLGYADFYAGVDSLLIGKTTYEQVLTFGEWPYSDKPTWVFAHGNLGELPARVQTTSAYPAEVANELDAVGAKRAWLVGGAALAGSFEDSGLISEYIGSRSCPSCSARGSRSSGTPNPRAPSVCPRFAAWATSWS